MTQPDIPVWRDKPTGDSLKQRKATAMLASNKWSMLASLLRHVLTWGGGFLVMRGTVDAGAVEQVVGAVITIGGVLWSVLGKTESAITKSAMAIESVQVKTSDPVLAKQIEVPVNKLSPPTPDTPKGA